MYVICDTSTSVAKEQPLDVLYRFSKQLQRWYILKIKGCRFLLHKIDLLSIQANLNVFNKILAKLAMCPSKETKHKIKNKQTPTDIKWKQKN